MFCADAVADYPVDLSEYENETGRTCAESCDSFTCSFGETCLEQAETSPVCTCPGMFREEMKERKGRRRGEVKRGRGGGGER